MTLFDNDNDLACEDLASFVSCDGEAMQLKAFMRSDIQLLLDTNNIMIGKLPASTSGSTQASDVSDFFKGVKTRLKKLGGQAGSNEHLQRRIEESLLRIINATSKVICKDDVIGEGYRRTGQYPRSVSQTLACCTNSDVTLQQKNDIISNMQTMCDAFLLHGHLPESVMDDCEV
eukprot:gene42374-52550_t